MLSIHDVERLQEIYPECRIQLMNGSIIITNPSDGVTGEIGARFGIGTWVDDNELGYVLGASAGLSMPNGDLLLARLSFPELFPGLEIPISRIWPRVYE